LSKKPKMPQTLTVEELCRKLRPILGKRIDDLYLKYSLADTLEQKREIEQMLIALYHKHLSESILSEKILLEPPPKEVIKGEYPLGIVSYADRDLYPFGLREQDWPRHVCISGMSGSGKTNFAFVILKNFIAKKKPFLVFDWKKSFRPLLTLNKNIMCYTIGNENVANFFKINVNRPPKDVAPKEWMNLLCDLINESFFASFGVHKIIRETMDEVFRNFGVYKGSDNFPTWHQILDRLEDKAEDMKRGREAEWMESALRIGHALTFGAFGEAINSKDQLSMKVEELLDKQVIFELHSLSSSEKKFFCEFILTYIYKLMKTSQQHIKSTFDFAILVDEAHNVFLKDRPQFVKESVTDMIYRELREYGISLICLDQHISKLSETVAGNSATNIAFQQMLPQDVDAISGLMQLREHKRFFTMLPVGQAIVKLAERYYSPFLIKVPMIDFRQAKITDEEIRNRMKDITKYDKRMKLFKESCRLENIKKKIKAQEDMLKHIGVEPAADFTKQQLIENLVKYIKEQRYTGYHPYQIRDHLLKCGYRLKDINKALEEVSKEEGHITDVKKSYLSIKPEISPDEANMLRKLLNRAYPSTTALYKALKLSARKGNTLKKGLLKKGLITVKEIRTAKGWKKSITITDLGRSSLEAK